MTMNRAILIGNVGRDPEIRRTGSGDPVANFSIATSDSWRDKATGERKDRTEWHNLVCFNEGLCKVIEQYVKKGSQIAIEGEIRTREYTDRDGNQRKATEIVLPRFGGSLKLLGKREGGSRSEDDYGTTRTREGSDSGRAQPASGGRMNDVIDDDIPF